jgi:hypothetical protein
VREEKERLKEEDDDEKECVKGLGEERECADENQVISHSIEHFCLTLMPLSLLSNGNRRLFPRRKRAEGRTGTARLDAGEISEVCGTVNQFFHVSI